MTMNSNYDIFLNEKIGRGANTVVFRGFDRKLNRFVAIKQLDEEHADNELKRTRFVQQAQFLANLSHENLLNVYALEGEQGWIVMELMRGSLKDKIVEGPVGFDTARSILRQALQAVGYLHDGDRIHGSIRPSNILINDRGQVKLSDFEDYARKGALSPPAEGQSKYGAPELWKAQQFGELGPSIDFYCLGLTVLELLLSTKTEEKLLGENAIAYGDIGWIRFHTAEDSGVDVAGLVKKIPDDLAKCLTGMLRRKVKDRFSSAHQILKILEKGPNIAVTIAGESRNVEEPELVYPPFGKEVPEQKDPEIPGTTPPTHPPGIETVKGLDLSDKKTLCMVAAVVLSLLAIVGVSLQWLLEPSTVEVSLEILPADAKVFLLGSKSKELLKLSKDQTVMLPIGTQKLRAEAGGYVAQEFQINVQDQVEPVEISLSKDLLNFSIAIEPSVEMEVLAEGESLQRNQDSGTFQLVRGTHSIEIRSALHESREEILELAKEGQEFGPFSLDPKTEKVAFSFLDDTKITVLVDGIPVKPDPAGNYRLPWGIHEVAFVADSDEFLEIREAWNIGVDDLLTAIKLPLSHYEVAIDLDPPEAQVFVDGVLVEPENGRYRMAAGPVNLQASLEGYETEYANELIAEDTLPLALHLKKFEMPNGKAAAGRAIAGSVKILVFPTDLPNALARVANRDVRLVNGEGEISWEAFDGNTEVVATLWAEGISPATRTIAVESLREQGSAATVEFAVPLPAKERARLTWLFARRGCTSNPARSVELLTEAIALDGDLGEAVRDRGWAYEQLGKFEEANRDLKPAINILPNDYHALSRGGLVNFALGQEAQAKEYFDRAILQRPKSSAARYGRAEMAYRNGDFATAEGDLEMLWRYSFYEEQRIYAANVLASIFFKREDFERGIRLFDETIKRAESAGQDATEPKLNKARALLLLASNESQVGPDVAKKFIALARVEAMTIETMQPEYRIRKLTILAEVEFRSANHPQSLELCNLLIDDLQVQSKKVFLIRASVLEQLGRTTESQLDREKAQQLK